MDKEEMLNNLYQILNEELKIYKYIINISQKKTKIIVNGNIEKLEEITKIEQGFVTRIGKLEDLREKLVISLSKELFINADKINITEIIKKTNGDISKKLKMCQKEIFTAIDELKNLNEVNGKLIKNSIEYVDFSINMLTNIDDGTNNYGNTGSTNKSKKKNYFDMKL